MSVSPPTVAKQTLHADRTTQRVSANLCPQVSVVLPCLNEAETLRQCIEQIRCTLNENGIIGEVIVGDNGSTDGSVQIALDCGARVVHVAERGYGAALMGGIAEATAPYVIMGDADMSYNFCDIPKILRKLENRSELVMGNRFRGGIKKNAMPPLHKYLGNPVLTGIGRLLFKSPCSDFHCGLRGFAKSAYDRMDLRTTGMEFASEMVVKATLFGMVISEVPTTLSPDGRSRAPHLRSWRDGWRHLRFLLMYSPRWLFLYPGAGLMTAGLLSGGVLLTGPKSVGGITFDIHTLLYCALAVLIGFQAMLFAIFSKVFAITEGLLPEDARLNKLFHFINLERGLVAGSTMLLLGFALALRSTLTWEAVQFGALEPAHMVRWVASSVVLIAMGTQTCFASFFFSILGLRRKR